MCPVPIALIAAMALANVALCGEVTRSKAREIVIELAQAHQRDAEAIMQKAKKEYDDYVQSVRSDIGRAKSAAQSASALERRRGEAKLRKIEREMTNQRDRCKGQYDKAKSLQASALKLKQLAANATPLELQGVLETMLPALEWAVGKAGVVTQAKTIQRIDRVTFLGSCPRGTYGSRTFLASGWDVSNIADGEPVKVGLCVVVRTQTYETVTGGQNTVYVIEPITVVPDPPATDGDAGGDGGQVQ